MAEQSSETAAQSAFMCQFCDQQNVKWKCEDCGIFICSMCKEKIHSRLKSSNKHRVMSIKDIGKIPCFEDELWYHGKISRTEAVVLLQKYKYMGDGAFLVRESETSSGNYSLDVLINGKPIPIRINTKEESGRLMYFFTKNEHFDSLNEVIDLLKHKGYRAKQVETEHVTVYKVALADPIPKETIR
ncbi:PLCG1 [Mytilus edulis]|uniref:PLCG1 n=1 Tax=Mytilus edulis TaxID=6550 RepID=A0A8S3TBV7_MYTED|nr:PLCG1 [Mytilus edulis]